jgi:sugar phosphate isomerase/epimerase
MNAARPQVGIDNYGLFPLGLGPQETLEWAAAHQADGVAFSGFPPEQQAAFDAGMLREVGAFARERGLYVEWGGAQHIPRDMASWAQKDLAPVNRATVAQATAIGAQIIRSCSGGLMRWNDRAPATETLLRETAQALRAARPMLADNGLVLAIETHFEFTSHELVRLIEQCEAEPGGWLGICLDTMNLLTMLEEPVSATRRLLPWVVSTHIKDGGLRLGPDGMTTFTAPIAEGVIDLRAIVSMVGSLGRPIHFSVEDHGGSFDLPIYDPLFLSKFPDLDAQELARLVRLAEATARRPSCLPLPRPMWPAVCEARLAGDVAALREIVRMAPPVDAGLEPGRTGAR